MQIKREPSLCRCVFSPAGDLTPDTLPSADSVPAVSPAHGHRRLHCWRVDGAALPGAGTYCLRLRGTRNGLGWWWLQTPSMQWRFIRLSPKALGAVSSGVEFITIGHIFKDCLFARERLLRSVCSKRRNVRKDTGLSHRTFGLGVYLGLTQPWTKALETSEEPIYFHPRGHTVFSENLFYFHPRGHMVSENLLYSLLLLLSSQSGFYTFVIWQQEPQPSFTWCLRSRAGGG